MGIEHSLFFNQVFLASNKPGELCVFDAEGNLVYYANTGAGFQELTGFMVLPEGIYSYDFRSGGETQTGEFVHAL